MDPKECELILNYLIDQTYPSQLSKQEKRKLRQKSEAFVQEDRILYHKGKNGKQRVIYVDEKNKVRK